ncbi:MAG: amino-acid N-acetyltransferase [Pseudomonadales bacterium]|nr:amino-acid N-acetyltransferase [Pseudomonadales bacterium]
MSVDTQQYVNWFRHSSPYINAYRGRVFVIMLPGEAIGHDNFYNIAHDITLLNSLGVKLVLVHGARPQIDAALAAAGLELRFHQGFRITDTQSMEYVKEITGRLRIEIEAVFSMGLINSPMHGADITISGGNFIVAQPHGVHAGVDLSRSGTVRKVNHEAIQKQLANGNVVLISSLGYSPTGEIFNLAVEELAAATAIALNADKLLIFGRESGILDQDGEPISKLSADEAQALINEKLSHPGNSDDLQLKNLLLSVQACRATVKRSQVISYVEDGALLTELFTRDGGGTLITRETYEQLRPASIDDVGGILELIEPLEEAGILVHRSRELLETEISRFTVIQREGTIIACGALYPLDDNTGELACVATHADYRDNGRGQTILERIEQNARKMGIVKLYVLTTKTPHWFIERGFKPCAVEALPERKKQLYNYQRNSRVFEKQL